MRGGHPTTAEACSHTYRSQVNLRYAAYNDPLRAFKRRLHGAREYMLHLPEKILEHGLKGDQLT